MQNEFGADPVVLTDPATGEPIDPRDVSGDGLTDAELRATPVPVSGTVTASGPLTDAQLRAAAVLISGTVTASGPLTDGQLRAVPVPVSGAVTTGGLTDAQLRADPVEVTSSGLFETQVTSGQIEAIIINASPVPVSGAVTTGGLTDAQLRATSIPALIKNSILAPAGSATYSASGTGYAAYATPTDLLTISGSASKTVLVTNFLIWMQSTTSSVQVIDFLKRSTANTDGAPTNPAGVPHDSVSAAATAVLNLYTAAPTTGTLTGSLRTVLAPSSTLTTTPTTAGISGVNNAISYPMSLVDSRLPVVLRGTAESLCLNYKGAALSVGFSATWLVEWIEF